jgi:preprotein translocase subunit SecG
MDKKTLWIAIIFALCCLAAKAQDSIATVQANSSQTVTEAHWDKATKGYDYSTDKFKERKKKKERNESQNRSDSDSAADLGKGFSNILQILAIVLAIALVGFGIFLAMKNPRDKKIQGEYDIEIDKIEERLHETDLMRYLREALAQKDYAVAIRLYYLQMLKDFSMRDQIKWSKEKTNRTYLNELFGSPLHAQATDNTRMYETVWFGNTRLNEASFKLIEPAFRDILYKTGNSLQ